MPVLIIKNDGLGDLILASGIIADLAARYGEVDLLTCLQNREAAEKIPGLRRLLFVSRDAIKYARIPMIFGLELPRLTAEDIEVVKALKNTEYDIAIVLRRFIRQSTLILMGYVRAQEKHCAWQYPTNTTIRVATKNSAAWNRFDPEEAPLSELLYYRQFLRKALNVISESEPLLSYPPNDGGEVLNGSIGISLGGNSTNWPPEYWARLVGLLQKGTRFIHLFGGRDVAELASRIEASFPSVRNHTGELSLGDSIPILRTLKVLVGNDTGFTHFASLTVERVLVILGGGTFGRFFPWPTRRTQSVIYHAMDCFDCEWNCKYPQRECLNLVLPERVAQETEELLAGGEPRITNLNRSSCSYRVGWRRTNRGEVLNFPEGRNVGDRTPRS